MKNIELIIKKLKTYIDSLKKQQIEESESEEEDEEDEDEDEEEEEVIVVPVKVARKVVKKVVSNARK